jgi:hypothetical protein
LQQLKDSFVELRLPHLIFKNIKNLFFRGAFVMYITDIEHDEFYTPTQLKKVLGLSIPTQAKMRARQGCFVNDLNPLPFIKLGARVIYRKSSIEAWIRAKENKKSGLQKGERNDEE